MKKRLTTALYLFLLFTVCLISLPTQAGVFSVLNTNDAGADSLRQALLDANASGDASDTINFNIPGAGVQTISPLSALPTSTKTIIIDGSTQPGFAGSPLIEVEGSSAGAGVDGLVLSGGNSTVLSLIINRFTERGIILNTAGGNIIQGCYIGTDATGTIDQGNSDDGIFIDDIPNNLIGGTSPGAGNLISGNGGAGADGILIEDTGATNNRVEGNIIGLDITGMSDLGNNNAGVHIVNASGNTVGGTAMGARNVISGNSRGIFITNGSDMNMVLGNFVSTDITGNGTPGGIGNNSNCGMLIQGDNNLVGGATPAARNIISGGSGDGICFGGGFLGVELNQIKGNYIGINFDGNAALANDGDGIANTNGQDNTFGGILPGEGNVISGNTQTGIRNNSQGAERNIMQGNLIGTDPTGTMAIPNGQSGIILSNEAIDNVVGGTDPGARNIISGNTQSGIEIFPDTSSGNQILGNFIGTDINGTSDLGNGGDGIFIEESPNNIIGGTDPNARNLISANSASGISIVDDASNNTVQGNLIGTDVTGALALPNGGYGIDINSSNNNLVGGNSPEAGNTIAFNTLTGVLVNIGTGNSILSNAIFENTDLGIELIQGGNNLQAAPNLAMAQILGMNLMVQGTLTSTANTQFNLQFFANNSLDPSGFGEGEIFLGEAIASTDGAGNVDFDVTANMINPNVDLNALSSQQITATATAPNGDTSEFSNGVSVVVLASIQFSMDSYSVNEGGGTATITITRSGNLAESASVDFMTMDGTAFSGSDYTTVNQTINFAAGISEQTVDIPILNNPNSNQDRTVLMALLNPTTGTQLGDPNTAILIIVDNGNIPGGGNSFQGGGIGCGLETYPSSATHRILAPWILFLILGLAFRGIKTKAK